MFRKLFIVLILASGVMPLTNSELKAQDPEFTQFYANPLYLNPAFAGSSRCPRLVLNYRNQWPALTGSFITSAASYDQYVESISGGLGVQVFQDDAGRGTLKNTSISGMYSYQKSITNEFSMTIGVQGTYFRKSLDWNKLTFGDMIDDKLGFIYGTQEEPRGGQVSNFDVSTGFLIFSDILYFGGAVHHLNEPRESLVFGKARLPMKFTGHIGGSFPIDGKKKAYSEVSISPNILYQRQADFEQINIGLYVNKGPIVAGVWYRNKDSFIALLGLQTEVLKIGYSYDLTVSRLTTQTAGSHEVSCAVQFDCKRKTPKFRPVNCPSF